VGRQPAKQASAFPIQLVASAQVAKEAVITRRATGRRGARNNQSDDQYQNEAASKQTRLF
jgi:hypothetical protein